MVRRFILKEHTRDVAVAAVYLIFLGVVLAAFFRSPSPSALPTYLLLLLFWAFGVLDEVLRRRYRTAYRLLMDGCDGAGALEQLDVLDKRDLLKGYRVRSVLLRGLALIDLGRVGEARALLLGHGKALSRAADSRFALCYLMFWCDMLERNLGRLKETYQTLTQFYEYSGSSARRQGVTPTSRRMVAGCFHFANRQYPEAERQFAAVPLDALSSRDRAWYAVFRARLARHAKDAAAEQSWLEQARALAPQYPCVREYPAPQAAEGSNAP